MKKVGLITYYGENYGGMLQAYALQRYVNDAGYDCQIISNDFLYQFSPAANRKHRLKNVKTLLKNPIDYLKRRKLMRQSAGQRAMKSQKFRAFCEKNLQVEQTGYTCYEQYVENPPRYDVYLCGSDQIWNPNLYHDNGFYFAGFAPEDALKISYASSVGVSSVSREQAAFMKPYLERLDVISTRETDGTAIVEQITGKKATTVVDPTLLLTGEQWSEVASQRLIREPYVFCYFFGERDYFAKVKQQVKALTGLKLVSIPYTAWELADDYEKIYDVGPAEFISLIRHAELVLTDSFHATAFSINLKTPFLSLCRFAKDDAKGMNSRLHNILGAMELTDRLVDEKDQITKDKLFSVDFDKAHGHLAVLREKDGTFLKDALQCERG